MKTIYQTDSQGNRLAFYVGDYVYRTLVVPDTHCAFARALIIAMAGQPGEGSLIAPHSPTGDFPITCWVGSGAMAAEFAPLLADPQLLTDACNGAITLAQAEDLLSVCEIIDLTQEALGDTLARLGLKPVSPPMTEDGACVADPWWQDGAWPPKPGVSPPVPGNAVEAEE